MHQRLREALIASGNADGYAARDLLAIPSMSKAITSAQRLELEAFVRMCGLSAGAIPRHFHSQLTATSDRAARPDAARTALPASAGDRKRSIRGFCGYDHPGLGIPESAPCP